MSGDIETMQGLRSCNGEEMSDGRQEGRGGAESVRVEGGKRGADGCLTPLLWCGGGDGRKCGCKFQGLKLEFEVAGALMDCGLGVNIAA